MKVVQILTHMTKISTEQNFYEFCELVSYILAIFRRSARTLTIKAIRGTIAIGGIFDN